MSSEVASERDPALMTKPGDLASEIQLDISTLRTALETEQRNYAKYWDTFRAIGSPLDQLSNVFKNPHKSKEVLINGRNYRIIFCSKGYFYRQAGCKRTYLLGCKCARCDYNYVYSEVTYSDISLIIKNPQEQPGYEFWFSTEVENRIMITIIQKSPETKSLDFLVNVHTKPEKLYRKEADPIVICLQKQPLSPDFEISSVEDEKSRNTEGKLHYL